MKFKNIFEETYNQDAKFNFKDKIFYHEYINIKHQFYIDYLIYKNLQKHLIPNIQNNYEYYNKKIWFNSSLNNKLLIIAINLRVYSLSIAILKGKTHCVAETNCQQSEYTLLCVAKKVYNFLHDKIRPKYRKYLERDIKNFFNIPTITNYNFSNNS